MHFNARVVRGQGRGKGLGTPTINLDVGDVPEGIVPGIFAGWVTIEHQKFPAAIHYGTKPFYGEGVSFEVHIIGSKFDIVPETVEIALVKRLRDIRNFPSEEALKKQMHVDIAKARRFL